MEHYNEMYEIRKNKMKTQYLKNSEIDKSWLEIYKERLVKREENEIYYMMKQGYEELKSIILDNH